MKRPASREPESFRIDVPDDVLARLRDRISLTRWPATNYADDWSAGSSIRYLQELLPYWAQEFDWRRHEQKLNELKQYRVGIDDFVVHFVHVSGSDDRARTPVPLLLTHGWPNTFADLIKLVPLLEGDFDLVIPSLPGYAYSEIPERSLAFRDVPNIWHRLMSEILGYERYGAYGYDLGAWVTARLAVDYPESIIGIHMTQVAGGIADIDHPSDAERAWMEASARWDEEDAAYSLIQETRPLTAAVGLTDSPAGLAAWIVEKLREWSDCHGEIESRWSKDEICRLLTIYWTSGCIGNSFRAYYDLANDPAPPPWPTGLSKVPAGFAMFPADITPPPRERAERRWNVIRWSEMAAGGHFPAVEEPALLAKELRGFFAALDGR